jgi:hypothetical protein
MYKYIISICVLQFRYLVEYIFENQIRFTKLGGSEALTLFLMEVKNSVEFLGVEGGQFFTVTFNFVGTVIFS